MMVRWIQLTWWCVAAILLEIGSQESLNARQAQVGQFGAVVQEDDDTL